MEELAGGDEMRGEKAKMPQTCLEAFEGWRWKQPGYETVSSMRINSFIMPQGKEIKCANGVGIFISKETITRDGVQFVPVDVTVPGIGYQCFYLQRHKMHDFYLRVVCEALSALRSIDAKR
jgi:hypothetical protein